MVSAFQLRRSDRTEPAGETGRFVPTAVAVGHSGAGEDVSKYWPFWVLLVSIPALYVYVNSLLNRYTSYLGGSDPMRRGEVRGHRLRNSIWGSRGFPWKSHRILEPF